MRYVLLLATSHSQSAMFSRSKASPATAVNNSGVNGNPYATNDPNRTVPGRGGASGFVLTKWLRLHLVDLVTMALMGAIGLGVYYVRKLVPSHFVVDWLTEQTLAPAPNRSFPVFHPDGSVVYPEYAYPVRKEIVPIWLAAFIAFVAPFVFFVLFQIRRRSLDDLFTTIMGLLKSLITAAVFQVPAFNVSFYLSCLTRFYRFLSSGLSEAFVLTFTPFACRTWPNFPNHRARNLRITCTTGRSALETKKRSTTPSSLFLLATRPPRLPASSSSPCTLTLN